MTAPNDAPVGVDSVEPVPHGHTAQRLTWKFLPPDVRSMVEGHLGAPVVKAESRDAGFTPGFASVLSAENGAQAFVKAASVGAQAHAAASYREEARKLSLLDGQVPAPRLEWSHDADWVVLGFEAITARAPKRPWVGGELARALDLAEEIAAATLAPPEGLELRPLHEDLPTMVSGWSDVPDTWPHHDDAAKLAASYATLPDADRFVHADLRDDNILLTRDGRALACDWNWPALGPAWLDLVVLLVSAHGDGHDADALLAERELTRDVDPDHVDAWLAGLCGFMLSSRGKPAPATSPHLRKHVDWYAEASWSWLARRRGWSH